MIRRVKSDITELAGLLYFPDIAAAEEFIEVSRAFLLDDGGDLFVDHVFVAGQVVPGTQNANGVGKPGRPSMWERRKA